MQALSAALYVLAYILAVIDGTRQRSGLYPSAPGPPIGLRGYARAHPWIVAGAVCGIAGVIVDFTFT